MAMSRASTRRTLAPLQLLAAGARETLQRYAITFWLLSGANPAINHQLAGKRVAPSQRLSVLHGINAPGSSTKRCSAPQVLTLRDEGYISDTGDAEPEETLKVYPDAGGFDYVGCPTDHWKRHAGRRVTRRCHLWNAGGQRTGRLQIAHPPGRGTAPARRSYCS